MFYLVDLKNIFSRQLPKMPREYISRLVFDKYLLQPAPPSSYARNLHACLTFFFLLLLLVVGTTVHWCVCATGR
jgi:hypothetical protein